MRPAAFYPVNLCDRGRHTSGLTLDELQRHLTSLFNIKQQRHQLLIIVPLHH